MTRDQKWIQEHFEELVENYAGRYIAVSNEEVVVGESLQEVRRTALKKYPSINPSILRVPRPEDFECALGESFTATKPPPRRASMSKEPAAMRNPKPPQVWMRVLK